MTAQDEKLKPRQEDPYVALREELPPVEFYSKSSALLVVDVQYSTADPDFGFMKAFREAGREEDTAYYRERLKTVVPNIASLLAAYRSVGQPVLHTHIQSLTTHGIDRSREHKVLGMHNPPGELAGEIVDAVAPEPGEVVLAKTASSVFNSTNINYILRNMGVTQLAVCGLVTTGCVETAVRDAADLGYAVALIEDACAALVEDMHWSTVRVLRDAYSKINSTSDVLDALAGSPA